MVRKERNERNNQSLWDQRNLDLGSFFATYSDLLVSNNLLETLFISSFEITQIVIPNIGLYTWQALNKYFLFSPTEPHAKPVGRQDCWYYQHFKAEESRFTVDRETCLRSHNQKGNGRARPGTHMTKLFPLCCSKSSSLSKC